MEFGEVQASTKRQRAAWRDEAHLPCSCASSGGTGDVICKRRVLILRNSPSFSVFEVSEISI